MSSYYLNLNRTRDGAGEDRSKGGNDKGTSEDDGQAARRELKDTLARERKRIEQLDVPHKARQALLRDRELVAELAMAATGDRYTAALACFVASGSGYSRALRLAWPVRERAFFEDRFVLWPLHQILDQSDRYAICLADKDKARLFLYYFGQIEEVKDIVDEIPAGCDSPTHTTSWSTFGRSSSTRTTTSTTWPSGAEAAAARAVRNT